MVLVKDDEIPVFEVDELVLRLDAARLAFAEQILERAEADNGPRLVRPVVLHVDGHVFVRRVLVGDELPALEVDVPQKVFPPGGLDRRLERQD